MHLAGSEIPQGSSEQRAARLAGVHPGRRSLHLWQELTLRAGLVPYGGEIDGAGMKTVSENASFGGVQGVYSHASDVCGCEMTFAVYLPPQAKRGKVPVLWYLSGLTCTHENAMTKAGAQGWAAEEGIAVVFPDTSPRGEGIANDAAFDLGQGAGFYVNATEAPWAPHFRMWDYVVDELPDLVFGELPLDRGAAGDHRALDGRARRADHRDDAARDLPLAVGDRADRQSDALGLGAEAVRRLPRAATRSAGRRTTRRC